MKMNELTGEYHADVNLLNARITVLEYELETERIRLAACGVVALSNTTESAKESRIMKEEYMSASAQDVMRAVDREMELRLENKLLREDIQSTIAGALYDLFGYLTTLDCPVTFSSKNDSAPAVCLIKDFANKRKLNIDKADVENWSRKI